MLESRFLSGPCRSFVQFSNSDSDTCEIVVSKQFAPIVPRGSKSFKICTMLTIRDELIHVVIGKRERVTLEDETITSLYLILTSRTLKSHYLFPPLLHTIFKSICERRVEDMRALPVGFI